MTDKYDPFDLSEGDEDYQPEGPEEHVYLAKRSEPKEIRQKTRDVLREMDKYDIDTIRTRISIVQSEKSMDFEDRVRHAKIILENIQKKLKPSNEGTFHFAGKLYRLNEKGELEEVLDQSNKKGFEELQKLAMKYSELTGEEQKQSDRYHNIQEEEYRSILLEKKANLRHLVALLNNRHRNMSAIFKSKIDWKKYTSMNQLDKQLELNRKDGFIEKQRFLVKASSKGK